MRVPHPSFFCLGGFVAWCPRFASVFWTLTWVEEGSGRPNEHFRLTISGRPLRFDFHHSVLPESSDPRLAQHRGEPGAPGTRLPTAEKDISILVQGAEMSGIVHVNGWQEPNGVRIFLPARSRGSPQNQRRRRGKS